MKKKIVSILVCMLLCVTVSSVTGTINIENADVCPNPGSSAATRDPLTVVIDLDAQTPSGDNQCLGAEYDGTYLWATGGFAGGEPNKLYKFDISGTLLNTYDQPSATSGWGIRDLAFDGTYLYGGCEAGFWQIDPSDGTFTLLFSSISPMTCIRALAWEPNEGVFYSGNFGEGFYKFPPDGSTKTPVNNPGLTAVYGMAYDNYHDTIWIFDQTGTPQTTLNEYDHHTETLTGHDHVLPLLSGLTAQISGGLFYAEDVTGYVGTAILGGMVQGTALDRMFCADHGTINTPPNTPSTPDGPDNGVTGVEYEFETETTDPEGDQVSYMFDWGDGTFSDWSALMPHQTPFQESHAWDTGGDYEVRAKAKDANDGESDWSSAHTITILEGPIVDIGAVTGGLFKINAKIENEGAVAATGVQWSISLVGGAFIGKETSGTDDIPALGEITATSKLIIGFGATVVTVTAEIPEMTDTKELDGFVFLFFINVKPSGG